jgi:hypothetical protein
MVQRNDTDASRAARIAGIVDAAIDTTVKSATTVKSVAGSKGDPEQQAGSTCWRIPALDKTSAGVIIGA